MRKLFLTWSRTDALIVKLSKMIRKNFSPDFVVGVARGGLVPAIRLSHLLDSEFRVVQIRHYSANGRLKKPKLISGTGRLRGRVLVVDDVADTGKTLNFACRYVRRRGSKVVKTATLGCKPHAEFIPDYFVFESARWMVFPWERRCGKN